MGPQMSKVSMVFKVFKFFKMSIFSIFWKMIIFWFLFVFCIASTDFWSRFWDTLYQENDRDSRDSFHDLSQVSENCILNCIYQHINHLCCCYLLYEHVADRQKTFYSQVPGLFHHNSAKILQNAIVMQNLFLMG